MPLPQRRPALPPTDLFYVAWGLGKVDFRLYKSKGQASNRVAREEAKGNFAQIWKAERVEWTDVSTGISDPERREAAEARQMWAAQGGILRQFLLEGGAGPVDFVRNHQRLESALRSIDALVTRFGRPH